MITQRGSICQSIQRPVASPNDYRKLSRGTARPPGGFTEVFHIACCGCLGDLRGMTIKARVHNRTIVLPADVEITEGAEVQVIVPERPPATNSTLTKTPEWLQKAPGTATRGSVSDFIGEWAGAFTVPAPDAADEDMRLAYLLGKHVK